MGEQDYRTLIEQQVSRQGIDYTEVIARAAERKGIADASAAIERFEVELLTERAIIEGETPEAYIDQFRMVLSDRSNHRRAGAELQRQLQELSPHFGFHRRGKALPEGVEPIPEEELKGRWSFLRFQQRQSNLAFFKATGRANLMLGGQLLVIPDFRKPKGGGGKDAT